MMVVSFLHFFNLIVFMYLAGYVLINNPRALVNRVCAAMLFCFAVWSFTSIFIHNPYASKQIAILFTNIGSFGWGSFSSFFLWFMLAFSEEKKLLKKKWFYLLLFALPLLFIYKQWSNFIFVDYVKESYGWKSQYSQSIWPHLFYIYYLSFIGIGLYINLKYMRTTWNPILKKQIRMIFITVLVTLFLGTLTDVLLPILNIHSIPNIGDTFVLIWACGTVYAMAKYKFLAITPATAADNIISTMYDCLILLNPEGNIVEVNKATSDLLGFKANELKGTPVSMLLAEEDLKNSWLETIVRVGNLKNKDFVFKTKEREKIPVIFSSSVLRDDAGMAAGIICVAKDISERKKMEEEILKGKKLEAIGILAGGIAHDFNNILSVIIGNLSLAIEDIESNPKRAVRMLKNAEKTSIQATELSQKLITFSRGGWIYPREITFSAVLKSTREQNPGMKTILHNTTTTIPPGLKPLYGDERYLSQVIRNLLQNADEAAAEPKQITLEAENVTLKKHNDFELKYGDYIKISITDNGRGIPKEQMGKIFDPYFSTKNTVTQKGLGLGLAICYSIIKKHNGHIAVKSEVGKGTTVEIYLPAYKE